MPVAAKKRKTPETRRVEAVFREAFPTAAVEAYRYNVASIRLRVIDPMFESKNLVEREAVAWPVLERLSEKTKDDVTVLLLLTPEEHEHGHSMLDSEFDDPTPPSF